jgi:hypothetical protein
VSKPTEKVLLVPGPAGWEIWTGQAESGFVLHSAPATSRAGDLTGLPAGDVLLFFPVKAITAIPMKVTSEDDSLFPELATMHAERLGMRPDPMAGQLTDTFVIAREGETTALLAVHLRPPVEGDLPTRGPKEFDISARAFPIPGDCLAVWKEFGRWVFALSHEGKIVYCQATSVTTSEPDDDLVREIRLAQIQLSLQGIELDPQQVLLWTYPESSPGALAGAFPCPVSVTERPAPILPATRSKLLPADVRAARRAAQRRRNTILAVAAVVLAYLGVIGYFGSGLWQLKSATARLDTQAKNLAPDRASYEIHQAKWAELAHAVDLTHSPVDILYRVSRCIPPGGLRLKTAEITAVEITLTGEGQQPAAVNQFSLALKKSNDLRNFIWQTPEPAQSTRGWEFNFTAAPPKN